MKRFLQLFFLCAFILSPSFGNAQTYVENSGFVSSVIWYSKDPFAAEEKIRVYTLVYNASPETLRGTVVFTDKEEKLGEYTFSIGSNQAKDISIPWTPKAGRHSIAAHIENAELVGVNGKITSISLASAKTPNSERVVEEKPVDLKTVPAEFVHSAAVSFPVSAVSSLVSAVLMRTQEALPETAATYVEKAVDAAEKKRTQAVVGLRAKNEKNNAGATVAALKDTPLATVSLFATTTLEAIARSPFFFYSLAVLGTLWLIGRIRRSIRGY